jgi:hypothetical protein
MFWFIVILLLAGAGFYFYQKLMTIEQEIRAEQEADQATEQPAAAPAQTAPVTAQQETSDSPIVTPEVEKLAAKVAPVADASLSLEDEILAAVKNLPGVKQTELYGSFSDVSKKQLQQLIKDLADNGQMKREKKGNSYLLYPA